MAEVGLGKPQQNARTFLNMYKDILVLGDTRKPRGTVTREILDYSFTIHPEYPCITFEDRGFNLRYAAAELIWYLVGDRYDLSICEFGSMWKTLIQSDGGLNSNYGQTIFGDGQFKWVVEELSGDPDSRRAIFIIGDKLYLRPDVNDQRCCQTIQFLIRDGYLSCFVNFRSSDAVWGVTNDIFTLCEIMKYVWLAIKHRGYPDLKLGYYHQRAISLHVYEKHFEMVEKILHKGMGGFYEINIPQAKRPQDYSFFNQKGHDYVNSNRMSEYQQWLYTRAYGPDDE